MSIMSNAEYEQRREEARIRLSAPSVGAVPADTAEADAIIRYWHRNDSSRRMAKDRHGERIACYLPSAKKWLLALSKWPGGNWRETVCDIKITEADFVSGNWVEVQR